MTSGYLKKYKIQYVVKNTTGIMYAINVSIDKPNYRVTLKSTIYGPNVFDLNEKLDWKCIADVLMKDPIIGDMCNTTVDYIADPKSISIISYNGKKFRRKHWYVLVDNNSVIMMANRFMSLNTYEKPEMPVGEYTVNSIDSFGLEVNIKMKSSLPSFIYLLKRTHAYIQETKYSGSIDK